MKPLLLKLESSNSYNIRTEVESALYGKYYYHPQIELVYFEKSDGICIIGDKVTNIKEGDIFLLGQNLPHLFKNDEKYSNKKLKVRIIVLHFLPDMWGKYFLELPDLRNIKILLKKAERGILIQGKVQYEIGKIMKQMLNEKGPDRIILLLQVLSLIAKSKNQKILLPIGFQPIIDEHSEDRINDIYSYTMKNFNKKINTKEIAAIAYLSEHSFCRYFKSKTGKTYSNFLHEIRIKHACKLLTESKLTIAQIINECGFVNFTNFFRYFKQINGKTPAEYQKLYADEDFIHTQQD
ncbi:MAG: AraC family transcriptional regulator [Sediminibacterium sp.]